MTDLSPAAQSVRFAYGDCIGGVDAVMGSEWRGLAAGLRALAEQVVPEQSEPPSGDDELWPHGYQLISDGRWEQRQVTRGEILAIAAKLEKGDG